MKAREFTKCICCGEGMAKGITFLRVRIDYMMLNPSAIQRQRGLEMMVGNAAIAGALGLDEDIATQIDSASGLICGSCMLSSTAAHVPFVLFEILGKNGEHE